MRLFFQIHSWKGGGKVISSKTPEQNRAGISASEHDMDSVKYCIRRGTGIEVSCKPVLIGSSYYMRANAPSVKPGTLDEVYQLHASADSMLESMYSTLHLTPKALFKWL